MMARIAAQDSFEEGSKDLFAYAGVKVGPKAIARMAELVAPQMRAAHAVAKPEQNTAAIPVMYIEGDGTGVPVRKNEARGRKAKNGEGEAKTREVKLGCVFTQTSPDAEGKPQRDHNSTTYVGTLQCSEDFGTLLRREAFARGLACAQKTVYLGDGAAWVWEVARINFPQAICILDFYHASEHLSLLAEALYSADPHACSLKPKSGGQCSERIASKKSSPKPAKTFPTFPDHAVLRKNRSPILKQIARA